MPIPKSSRFLRFLLILAALTIPAAAHIGSPDTFIQTTAGPYTVLLAVHPPAVYPGALELDLRLNPDDHITTATVTLDNTTPANIALIPDGTSATSLWASTPTAHKLHITLQGTRGPGDYTVTLPAGPTQPKPPASSTALILGLLTLSFLCLATWKLFTGRRRQGLSLLGAAAVMLAFTLYTFINQSMNTAGNKTTITANLTADGTLDLVLTNPNESFADLTPDHGKLLHLFLIRQPSQDVFLHLHPQQLAPGHFTTHVPAMPPGTYTLFADFYHRNGTNETGTLTLDLPAQSHTTTTDPDNSIAILPPATSTVSLVPDQQGTHTIIDRLPDNYTLTLTTPTPLTPLHANLFTVTLLDPTGKPPADMALYLGMSAHAVVLRDDNGVFAHIHPGGTLPMLMPTLPDGTMPGMTMPPASNTATIPYGFPSSGQYRLFVQMKHGHFIETAAFGLTVTAQTAK